jgi:periplasmic protein TonB
MRKPAAAASVAFHGAALLLLFSLRFYTPAPVRQADVRFLTLSALPRTIAKDGGGGQRQPLPASRGRAPQITPRKFSIPPSIPHNPAPKLILDQSLIEAPDANIQSTLVGDPLAPAGIPSGGLGGPVGIGNKGSGGIGNGPGGPRLGDGAKSALQLTRQPEVIYKEEPEYSEEARKARYEGTVVVAFDVDVSGRPIHIRVVRSLGMGLDEKAMESVARWKFRPAAVGDKAVVAPAEVFVTFRLL